MNSDLTEDQWKQMADTEDQVELGMPAVGDQNRCSYTVHANGDWGDYRCELVVDHPGPHAIGLRYHAVPVLGSIIPFAADLREERDLLRKRMEGVEKIKIAANGLFVPEFESIIEEGSSETLARFALAISELREAIAAEEA